jgi:hypothetical protein
VNYLPLFHHFKAIYQFPKHLIGLVKIVTNALVRGGFRGGVRGVLFLISFDGFQLNLENTSTTENASSLLIFKFRGQGHGDILLLAL